MEQHTRASQHIHAGNSGGWGRFGKLEWVHCTRSIQFYSVKHTQQLCLLLRICIMPDQGVERHSSVFLMSSCHLQSDAPTPTPANLSRLQPDCQALRNHSWLMLLEGNFAEQPKVSRRLQCGQTGRGRLARLSGLGLRVPTCYSMLRSSKAAVTIVVVPAPPTACTPPIVPATHNYTRVRLLGKFIMLMHCVQG